MSEVNFVTPLPPPPDPHQVRVLVTGKRPKRKMRKRGKVRVWAYWWR